MNQKKDRVVVTISHSGDLHVYGPYTLNEAARYVKRFEFNTKALAVVRKLINADETNVKPASPRGIIVRSK